MKPSDASLSRAGLQWMREDFDKGSFSHVPDECFLPNGEIKTAACFKAITGYAPDATGLSEDDVNKLAKRANDWRYWHSINQVPILKDIAPAIVTPLRAVAGEENAYSDFFGFIFDPMNFVRVIVLVIGGGLALFAGMRLVT